MRFLVDQNLSPLYADELRSAGHDVVHTRDIDLRTAGVAPPLSTTALEHLSAAEEAALLVELARQTTESNAR